MGTTAATDGGAGEAADEGKAVWRSEEKDLCAADCCLTRVCTVSPQSVVSDRGPQFGSNFWDALGLLVNMRVNLLTAYHPQTNGQTERTNRTLGDMLRAYADTDPRVWSAAEFTMNKAVNRSMGQSPFFLNYGFHPAMPVARELDVPVPVAKGFVKSYTARIAEAKRLLEATQQRAADYRRRA
jgi:hypothetical protein